MKTAVQTVEVMNQVEERRERRMGGLVGGLKKEQMAFMVVGGWELLMAVCGAVMRCCDVCESRQVSSRDCV